MTRRFSLRIRVTPWQRTLYILAFAQLGAATGFSLIFPFLPLYIEELGSNTGISLEFWAGMVYSAQGVAMMIASPIWGSLADRHGRKLMVVRAMFGAAVILFLMGLVRTAEELVLLRIIQGLVTGTISAINALVAAEVPRHRVGYAMGILQVGLWGGIAVGPLLGGIMADAWGFRIPFMVTSVLLLLAGLLVVLGVEEHFQPPVKSEKGRVRLLTQWRHILSMPGVGPTYSVRFLSTMARMMIFPITPLFVQSLLPAGGRVGLTTGLVIGLSSAAATATAIYFGRLGDRVGHRRILTFSLLAAALLYFPQTLVTAAWQLLVLQALTGAAIGGFLPTISALLAGYTHQGDEGASYGLDNSVISAARAAAPLIGAGVAIWFGLRGTFVAVGVILLVTAALAGWWLPKNSDQSTS